MSVYTEHLSKSQHQHQMPLGLKNQSLKTIFASYFVRFFLYIKKYVFNMNFENHLGLGFLVHCTHHYEKRPNHISNTKLFNYFNWITYSFTGSCVHGVCTMLIYIAITQNIT